jgi:hypothetical protein
MFLMMACDLRQGLSSARDRRCLFGEVWWKQPLIAEGNTTAHSCEVQYNLPATWTLPTKISSNTKFHIVCFARCCTEVLLAISMFARGQRGCSLPHKVTPVHLALAPDIIANASGSSWLLSGPRYNFQHPVQAVKHSHIQSYTSDLHQQPILATKLRRRPLTVVYPTLIRH